MRILLLMFVALIISSHSFAQNEITFCRYRLQNSSYDGYLYVSLEESPNQKYTLWLEREIPWGIRRYSYQVSKIACGESTSVEITATSSITKEHLKVIFTSNYATPEWQPGVLVCSSSGSCQWKVNLECSLKEMKKVCTAQ